MSKRARNLVSSVVKQEEAAPPLDYGTLVAAIGQAHQTAQRQAVQAINVALTLRNWLIGYHIFEYEQHGSDRAKYGERLLDKLAGDLRKQLGRGFGKRYLEMFRQFYLRYPIAKTVYSQLGTEPPFPPSISMPVLEWQDEAYFLKLLASLSWGHFIELMRLDDVLKRAFHEVETLINKWSLRELRRQIDRMRRFVARKIGSTAGVAREVLTVVGAGGIGWANGMRRQVQSSTFALFISLTPPGRGRTTAGSGKAG